MKKCLTMAVVPLFASFLCAQQAQTTRTETTTTKTTWNGTLLDAACQTTHTEHKETTSTPEQNTTTTKTETRTECPATMESTAFGLLTPDGKYLRFDEPSNTKIVEIVKNNKKWHKLLGERAPLKVEVIGTANGNTVVLDTIK